MEMKSSLDKLVLAASQNVKERKYWLNKLTGEWVKTHFPYDYRNKRQEKKENRMEQGNNVRFMFPGPLYAKVIKLSGGIDVKLYMILTAGIFILLHKYTGNSDIMIGAPIFKQESDGEFINTVLVFRNEMAVHMSFKELLLEVRKTIIEATENQNYPLEVLLEELKMPVIRDEFPLFDTVLLLKNLHDKNYLQGIDYNMLFSFSRRTEEIEGVVEYNSLLYLEGTVWRIVHHYLHILDRVLADIDLPLREVDLLSEQEKQQLLRDFINTEGDYPREKLLHQLFEAQAERTPGSIAVIGESLELNAFMPLTYGELNTRSEGLAHVLREQGVEPDTIVALMVEPSVEMMICILGILKSGGAYLPIDPDCPLERVDYMLKESGAKILINKSEIRNPKFETNPNDQKINVQNKNVEDLMVLNFENLNFEFVSNFDIRASNFNSSNLAYIIYTSGTTGKPKGVMVEHRNVVAYVHAFLKEFQMDFTDTVIQLASYCFDVFVEEVYPVLSKGGRLVIPGQTEIVEIEGLSRLIVEYRVTMIDCTPMLLNEFDRLYADTGGAALGSVRTFISGGDVLKAGYVEHLIKTGRVYNTYGPTESTVCAAYYHYAGAAGDLTSIPIGKPISNYKIYILDAHRMPTPIGSAGELCVSGPGVVRGYLNRPELTAEKFKKYRSYRANRTNIIYRTGDLARWLADGNIEYLGRIDHQVKIRGFRIELGEIEAQLTGHKSIDKAVVIDRQEAAEDGDKYLCAYIVSREPFDLSMLRNYLSQNLPEYMIPAFFIPVDQIPLTPNGKVDRKALPAPKITTSKAYIPPGNKIEEKLVEIWGEILNLNREVISMDSDFFQLGGHSLKATIMVSRIHKELDIKLPVLEIFRNQTIRQLSESISRVKPAENRFAAIEPSEKKEYYVLSSAQRRLYFIFQLEEGSTTYNIPDIIPLEEKVDLEQLEGIFNYLIRRHDSLRTSIEMINEQPVQRIHDDLEFKIEILGVRDQGSMMNDFIRPFDLSRAPLLRAGLVKTREGNYFLLVDIHHIIMDAVSMNVLKGEFMKLYAGERGSLPVLNLQYRDYSEWQQHERESGALKAQEKFWLENLAGELPALRLPIDFPRPLVQSFEGNTADFQLEGKEIQRLKRLISESGSTLYIVLLSLFNLLLFKLSGQEDIIVGTVVAARRHADLENIIGMFVNTLAVRNFPCAEKSFHEFLEEIKQRTLAVYENQDYPFEDLVEKVTNVRDTGRNPVFDVVFALQNLTEQEKEIHRSTYDYEIGVAKFDMTLFAVEIGEKISFSLEYCTRLFKEETIRRFIGYFKNIINSIIENSSQRLCDVEMMTEVEKRQLLVEFNDTGEPYPNDKTIRELFENQVGKTPDRVALVGAALSVRLVGPVGLISLSYRQLNEQSGRLAYYLVQQGVRGNALVGLMMNRSLEMTIGILGILNAGCGYVPLNPNAPPASLEYILDECNARVLVTTRRLYEEDEKVRTREGQVIFLEDLPIGITLPIPCPIPHAIPSNLAYVIFTSGSMGKPKGVPISHANLSPLLHWGYRHLGLGAKDRFIQNLSYYFDWSVWEIIMALTTSAGLHMVPDELLMNPEKCIAYMNRNDITVLHVTPTQYQYYLNAAEKPRTLKYLFIGAEKLNRELVQRTFESMNNDCRVFNMYGPTECTIISAVLEIIRTKVNKFESLSSVPIGGPVANIDLFILDKYMNLCPLNVLGELHIAGDCVARGYLNNPELTAEKFNRSYRSNMTYIFYKTGDLCRRLPDGVIEFLGRIDRQVKIRGFRIELEEIESRLLKHPDVKEAKILDKADNSGDKYLCAYIVSDRSIPGSELREYLANCLPEYMIPTYFVLLDRIPLTPNGKVNLKALPEPGITLGEDYTVPSNETEEKIAAIWSEVLGIEQGKISIDADFFDLGGHSLKVIVMIEKIHKVLNLKLELAQVFRYSTVRSIASLIEALLCLNVQEAGPGIDGARESEEIFL